MTHDIFISYSSKDKPIADGICANLEASGLRCWIAPRDIIAGDDWPTAITAAISKSKVMVLIFSANSNASADVSREIILAANYKLVIIPFKIEDVEPEFGKQYYLARTHWLEAMNPPTREQIKVLVETTRAFIPAIEPAGIVQTVPAPLPSQDTQAIIQPVPAPIPAREQLPKRSREQPLQADTVKKKSWFRRKYLWIAIPVLLIILMVSLWPLFEGKDASPTAIPAQNSTATSTVTTTVEQTPNLTLPAAVATTPVETSAPELQFRLLKTLTGHTGEVRSLAFSNDGFKLASGSSDYSVIMWNFFSGTPLFTLRVHSNAVNSLAFHPISDSTIVSASADGSVMLWDPRQGDNQHILTGHTGAVNSVVFSQDGHYLASASNDNTIIVWDFQNYPNDGSWSKSRTITDHTGLVLSLAFSPDGKTLASGGLLDNTIMLHDPANGSRLGTLYGNAGDIINLAFSPDGKYLASASERETIILWDAIQLTKVISFKSGTCVAFSPDGKYLASGSRDGQVNVWEVATGNQLQNLESHSDRVISIAFSPDGNRLVSGSADGSIQIWELASP